MVASEDKNLDRNLWECNAFSVRKLLKESTVKTEEKHNKHWTSSCSGYKELIIIIIIIIR